METSWKQNKRRAGDELEIEYDKDVLKTRQRQRKVGYMSSYIFSYYLRFTLKSESPDSHLPYLSKLRLSARNWSAGMYVGCNEAAVHGGGDAHCSLRPVTAGSSRLVAACH